MKNQEIIRKIYREAFGNEPEFEQPLFENCGQYIRFAEKDGVPVSFYFALPCEIKQKNKSFPATYIFAAATHKDYRNQGLMGKLLEDLKKETRHALILRPANEDLINYYKKFGFTSFKATDTSPSEIYLEPKEGFRTLALKFSSCNGGEFVGMCYNSPINLDGLRFTCSMP